MLHFWYQMIKYAFPSNANVIETWVFGRRAVYMYRRKFQIRRAIFPLNFYLVPSPSCFIIFVCHNSVFNFKRKYILHDLLLIMIHDIGRFTFFDVFSRDLKNTVKIIFFKLKLNMYYILSLHIPCIL